MYILFIVMVIIRFTIYNTHNMYIFGQYFNSQCI
uniref:Uncharacterized protein n=1 Tax=viral metagenome TaxID=1070528 RepID=A0A6C0EGY9_9ZZZZ